VRVFIVEDSEPVKRRLAASLDELAGVEVVGSAASEAEAIASILAMQPDVAIVDIQLRTGNGMNVLQEVKRQHAGLKVIVLTNFGYPQYRRRCMEAGADHFLDKSAEFMAVGAIIAEWAQAPGPVA
jgi:DNA-binding NarL/FixJ family response regulator